MIRLVTKSNPLAVDFNVIGDCNPMINQPLFIKTSAGVISRDAVSCVQESKRGAVQVWLCGKTEPILINNPTEAAQFVKMLEPMVDVRANREAAAS